MNQSIIFTEQLTWDVQLSAIHFTAQQQGMVIDCYIGQKVLEHLAAEKINNSEQALSLFEQFRFDIEEQAEKLIEQEAFDVQGHIQVERVD
ncbi:DUF1488 domain-containing protein [Shewanella loihica]|uniref:Transcriptional regulator n=2 Tax=Shewanella loihica (strain ATCC BAA-1088 / PV-4) TaxID=323850 RepID=A3QJE4_SHELP|nr:DUF1488 domain-containing protein [Shewanella loihica]ABO25592.1 protein of unknown function DUF1488 [Shewanella loihica PV-4]